MSKKQGQVGEYWLTQKPGRPHWHRTWYDHEARQTRRESLGTADLLDAQLKLADWIQKNARMDNEKIEDIPLGVVLVRYWEGHAKHIRSANAQRISLGYWSEFFDGAMVSDLTIERQEQFVNWLEAQGHSSSYIKKIVGAGKWAMNRAHKRGLVTKPPHIIDVKEKNPTLRRLELREVRALVQASRQTPHLHMFVMLALNTLSRPGALLELTTFQCDLEQRVIYLNPPGREQTKKRRPIVPITDTIFPYIQTSPPGHLIRFRGRPVDRITTAWKKAVAAAGLGDDVVPMTLRRTMARELRRRGVQPWDVAGIMGHLSDQRTTEIYAEYDVKFLRAAVEAIDSYMAEVLKSDGSCPVRVHHLKTNRFNKAQDNDN